MPRRPHSSPQTLRVFASLLAEPTRWRHGYDLSKETGLATGSLYPILIRLEEQKLLEAQWQPAATSGRPPRHVYRLTSEGAALAKARLAEREQRDARPHPRLAMREAW